jgi:hypothetical protein
MAGPRRSWRRPLPPQRRAATPSCEAWLQVGLRFNSVSKSIRGVWARFGRSMPRIRVPAKKFAQTAKNSAVQFADTFSPKVGFRPRFRNKTRVGQPSSANTLINTLFSANSAVGRGPRPGRKRNNAFLGGLADTGLTGAQRLRQWRGGCFPAPPGRRSLAGPRRRSRAAGARLSHSAPSGRSVCW